MPGGRPPLPDNVRDLHGRSHHAPKPPAPAVPPGIPEKPPELVGVASDEWDRIVRLIGPAGAKVLTEADGGALAGYCQAYGLWAAAQRAINEHLEKNHGALTYEYKNKVGAVNRVAIPEIQIARDAMTAMRAFAVELGLTPSARGRAGLRGTGNAEKKGNLQDFLDRAPQVKGRQKA